MELNAFTKISPPAWLQGLKRIQESGFVRIIPNYEVAWKLDKVRCFQIGNVPNAPSVLIIPSLINRYYILDLNEKLSFARYLAGAGINVFLLDWDEPSASDGALDAAGYVIRYLQPLLEHLGEVHVMGYCVGGVLGLALAILRAPLVKSLILLATPWDFGANNYSNGLWNNFQQLVTHNWCDNAPLVSGEYLSWLFYLAEPARFEEKYNYFNGLSEDSEAYLRFLAVDNWVNDTVPLTSSFARDCLINWAENNATAKGEWTVAGECILPRKLRCPALVISPLHDKIVTLKNAQSIAAGMRDVTILMPPTGHIGMIIGRERVRNLWQPVVEWIANYS